MSVCKHNSWDCFCNFLNAYPLELKLPPHPKPLANARAFDFINKTPSPSIKKHGSNIHYPPAAFPTNGHERFEQVPELAARCAAVWTTLICNLFCFAAQCVVRNNYLINSPDKSWTNGIMLFPLFHYTRISTLLYPFKIHTILERTSNGFCTLVFWTSNVYILTFASSRIFSWPLVENPHFCQTVQILVGFHHFRDTLRPHLKFFHFFHHFFQNHPQNPLPHLRIWDHFLTKCWFSTTYAHISKPPKATICCPNYHNFDEFAWKMIKKHIYIYAD